MVPVPPVRMQDYTQLHFAHFANGFSITSDLEFVNVVAEPIHQAIYFYDGAGNLTHHRSARSEAGTFFPYRGSVNLPPCYESP